MALCMTRSKRELARDPGDRLQIDDAAQRIRRRLDKDHAHAAGQDRADLVKIARVEAADLDPEARQVLVEQRARSPVELAGGGDGVAPPQEPAEHPVQSRHSGGERNRAVGAFDPCHRGFEAPPRRVAVTRIELPGGFAGADGAVHLGVFGRKR